MRSALAIAVLLPGLAMAADINEDTGLIVDEHWQLVAGMCSSCHSLSIVTAQRGDRDYWLKIIRWMQNTQNLWALPPQVESNILDYLSRNYAEEDAGRRPPLPPSLMPGHDNDEH